jgi:hypothetical protein
MSDLRRRCESFDRAELAVFDGLPGALTLDELAVVLSIDTEVVGRGFLGSERRYASWAGAESQRYHGGVRVWHEDGRVLVLEGRDPVDAGGDPLTAPDLGEPDAVVDAMLGRVRVAGGELVYGLRGLALRVNPDNGLLLGALAFAPASADQYLQQLRPDVPPLEHLPERAPERSAA